MAQSKYLNSKDKRVLVAQAKEKCLIMAANYFKDWKPFNKTWPTREGAAYLRLSTEDQVLVKDGSLLQQVHIVMEEAKQRSEQDKVNYRVTKIYIDAGISGQKEDRPEFLMMWGQIKKERQSFVIIKELARIARDSALFKNFFQSCIEVGCEIMIRGFPINPNDPTSLFQLDVMAAVAQYEANVAEKRVRENVYSAMVNSGKFNSTHKIFGLDQLVINGEPQVGLYVPNKDELKTWQWIAGQFVKYESYQKTLHACEKRGIKNKCGRPFKKSALTTLLTNPRITGRWELNIENKARDQAKLMPYERYQIVDLPHGCLVDMNLWNRVQGVVEKLRGNKSKATRITRVYPLSGILKYEDGTAFNGSGGQGRGGNRFYYYQNIKNRFRIPVDKVEDEAKKIVAQVLRQSPELFKAIEQRTKKLTSSFDLLKGQLLNIEAEIEQARKEREALDKRLDFLLEGLRIDDAREFKESYLKKSGEIDKKLSELMMAKDTLIVQRRDFDEDQFNIKDLVKQAERVLTIMHERDPVTLKAAYRALFTSIMVSKMDENGLRKLTFNIRSDSEFRDFGNRAATVGFDEKMAQEEGFEPPTKRLTAACSTAELLLNKLET
jgi:DNA invertase Pin-like site-specific DNA recombinase